MPDTRTDFEGYDRQAIIDLLRFIDWLVILPEALEQNFWQAVLTYKVTVSFVIILACLLKKVT